MNRQKLLHQRQLTFSSLQTILTDALFPHQWEEIKELPLKGFSNHSGHIQPGDLFVAIPGAEQDGHCYIPKAKEKGAVAALVEKRTDLGEVFPEIVVPSTRKAQAQLSCAYYDDPSAEMTLVGITGSNGKTTTSLMLQRIIESAGYPCGLIGTVEYQTGQEKIGSKLTTPDSPELQLYLRQMVDSGMSYAVMEASSIGQSQLRNYGCHYPVAAFLNLGREHIDYHGSYEAYFEAKKKLITNLPASSYAVLNRDDPAVYGLCQETVATPVTFGYQNEALFRAANLDLSTGFASFTFVISQPYPSIKGLQEPDTQLVKLSVPGMHSVYNALAAMSCGLVLGFSLKQCVQGIESYFGVERRFQQVYKGEFRIFDDHFANSGNIHLTLATLEQMSYERLHIVYAIRGNRGVTVNRENIQMLLKHWPKLRCSSFVASRSRDTAGHYDEVKPEEERVFEEEMKKGGIEYQIKDTLKEAVLLGISQAQPGDLILLAGCQGMDAGARFALNHLVSLYPDRKEEILEPLANRVCGWE